MQAQNTGRYKRREVDLEELKSRQHNKRVRRRVFYIALFSVLVLVFTAVCFLVLFKIETVEVKGLTGYSKDEIIAAFGVKKGENLYSFSASEIEKKLVTELPYINSVEIERDLPSTVVIHVKEKEPCMYVELNDEKYLLTDDMHILEYTDSEDKLYGLLKVQMEPKTVSRCIVGEKLSFIDKRTGDIVSDAYAYITEMGLINRVNYIDANNRFGIYLGLDGCYDVYMGDIEEFDTKLLFAKGIADKLHSLGNDEGQGKIDVSEVNKGIYTPKEA
ncbi:MAG: FtsQ-type POTRA domain-containing protein [Clostridia bacterium]|nr:FtsQ-type POTRA domain-containing protein [Clostridia bacterium]MBQ7048415.1 FtsQ-type POTRA domain-containing protein [Clostridia bacterium]